MSDIKLFRMKGAAPIELSIKSVELEKPLQNLIEKNLEAFLGVRFVATEHSTGKAHGGRIDTLGLDENGCPVIIEYKRNVSENVINQGLFYLDWLVDHRGDFSLLVESRLGKKAAERIEWSAPRLVCVAADFTKYDSHAVQQMGRNIELIRYRHYTDDVHLFEQVSTPFSDGKAEKKAKKSSYPYKTAEEHLESAPEELRDLFDEVDTFLTSLGDDVQKSSTLFYIAYKRIKNFACVEIRHKVKTLLVFVKVDPKSMKLEKGFTRNVSEIGHFGTGDLEITLRSHEDLDRAKALLQKSYEA